MTGGISSRRCYTKLNFDFPYVRFLSLRRNTYTFCVYVFAIVEFTDTVLYLEEYLSQDTLIHFSNLHVKIMYTLFIISSMHSLHNS